MSIRSTGSGQVWLSAEEVNGLGVSERTLRDWSQKGKLTTRVLRQGSGQAVIAANGRPRREIALESLPPEVQSRYFKSFDSAQGRSQISNDKNDSSAAITEDGESAKAPTSGPAGPRLPAALTPPGAELLTGPAPGPLSVSGASLAALSEADLDKLTDYAEKIKMADGKSRQQRRWIARGLKVSVATLDRDLAAFREHGLAALVRAPRADRGAARVADKRVVKRIQNEYLQPHRPKAAEIHRVVERDYILSNRRPPSYAFVLRTVRALAPDLVSRFRVGEKDYDDKFAYYTQRKKPPAPRLWVDSDHHICDHLVVFRDGSIGRPWLTAVQDICTNEILGFRLTKYKPRKIQGRYPDANTIALALRHAILRKPDPLWPSFGLFGNFYADLGRDFRSLHVRAVCGDLNIQIRHARGYHGKSKPIERWFGVMEMPLGKLPGYVGRSPENNPERQRLGAPRSAEDMRGELLTVDQYEAAVYDWIVKVFHHTDSRALSGLSPIAALEAHVKNGWSAREIANERALDLLLMRRAKKRVQRRGIEMFGTQYDPRFFGADELLDLVGQEVEVCRDPCNIGEIVVYKDNRFVCVATNRELLDFGASEETLERERAIRRTQRQRLQQRHEELFEQAQYPNLLARAAAEERYEKVMDEERRRIAVGAEPERTTAVMLPKHAHAARAIDRKRPALAEAKKKPSPVAEMKPAAAKEAWEIEDELPTGAEIFKREEKAEWEKALDAEEDQ
jgi:putative transposase